MARSCIRVLNLRIIRTKANFYRQHFLSRRLTGPPRAVGEQVNLKPLSLKLSNASVCEPQIRARLATAAHGAAAGPPDLISQATTEKGSSLEGGVLQGPAFPNPYNQKNQIQNPEIEGDHREGELRPRWGAGAQFYTDKYVHIFVCMHDIPTTNFETCTSFGPERTPTSCNFPRGG